MTSPAESFGLPRDALPREVFAAVETVTGMAPTGSAFGVLTRLADEHRPAVTAEVERLVHLRWHRRAGIPTEGCPSALCPGPKPERTCR